MAMTTQDTPEKTTTTETYAVIYDSWDYGEMAWKDDAFEPFKSEKAAEDAFKEMYGDAPDTVQNPRIVKVVREVSGEWGADAE
jgi:muramidase (phage lysozyme)